VYDSILVLIYSFYIKFTYELASLFRSTAGDPAVRRQSRKSPRACSASDGNFVRTHSIKKKAN
jgi:hypothetical protein